jgi:hypothetical protein
LIDLPIGQKQVARLEVAVDDTALMGNRQRFGSLLEQPQALAE